MESTDNGQKKPQGFAAFTPEKRLEAQRKGGSTRSEKTKLRGTASLSPEARRETASRAAIIRWKRVKEERLKDESDAQRQDNRDTPR